MPARLAGWQTSTYVGQPGDTLSMIAAANGLSLDELVVLNPGLTGADPDGRTLVLARRFAPAQLAVLTDDVVETLRLRRIP